MENLRISGRVRGLLLPVVIVLLGLAYYVPWIQDAPGFVGDDFYLIEQSIDEPLPSIAGAGESLYFSPFRPLFMFSLHVNHLLAGSHAPGYLYVNLLLFIAAGLVSSVLILRLQRDFPGRTSPMTAAFAVVLFLTHAALFYHPLWIAQRTETLMLLFWLGALYVTCLYIRRPGPALYGAVILLYLLSLLSKSTGLHFPLIFIGLHLLYRFARSPVSVGYHVILRRSLPLLLIMAGYLFLRTAFDPAAEPLPLAWLMKKPFSIVGMTVAAVYPPLAELLYAVAGYDVVFAVIATIVLTAAVMIPLLWYSTKRTALLIIAGMYLATFFPRIMAWSDPRTLSVQIVFLIVAAAVVLLRMRPPWRYAIFGLLLTSHILAGTNDMNAWIARETKTELQRYAERLYAGELDGVTAVFSEAHAQNLLPYQLYYFRYGTFGLDSNARGAGYEYYLKPFSRRTIPEVAFLGARTVRMRMTDERMDLHYTEPLYPDSTVAMLHPERLSEQGSAAEVTLRVATPRDRWAYLVILPDTVIAVK